MLLLRRKKRLTRGPRRAGGIYGSGLLDSFNDFVLPKIKDYLVSDTAKSHLQTAVGLLHDKVSNAYKPPAKALEPEKPEPGLRAPAPSSIAPKTHDNRVLSDKGRKTLARLLGKGLK